MEDNYILIRKSDNGVVFGLKKEINDIFSQIFNECCDGKVFFDDGSFLEYKLSNKDENLLYLKVTSDLSEMKAADLLDRFYCTLTKGNHRKNYYIVRAYSQSSLTYCCKLMKYFGEFERRLREFLYLVVIKTYGENWFEETFEKELSDKIKKRLGSNKQTLIENALEELTYEQLIIYIFQPQFLKDIDVFFKEINDESFFLKTSEEINNRIRSIRKLSLWERLFESKKELNDLELYIDELRPLRNSVMHHKNISKQDFVFIRKKLNTINSKLQKAIEEIENTNFAEFGLDYLVEIKNAVKGMLQNIAYAIQEFSENIVIPIREGLKNFNRNFINDLMLNYSDDDGDHDTLLIEESNMNEDIVTDAESDDNKTDEEKETEQ